MKPKSMLLLVVAAGCGLVAAFAVTQHLSGNQPAPQPQAATKKVVVAAGDYEAGTQLKPEMLATVEMAAAGLPEGTYSEAAELTGQTLRFPIFKSEMVLSAKVGGEKTLAAILKAIPAGMQLAQIRIEESDGGLRGVINPGSHVDVLWLPGRPELAGKPVITLMQDIKVLAVGDRFDATEAESSRSSKSGAETYTLLVTEAQQFRLAAASRPGKLRLAWRQENDKSFTTIDEDALDELLGLKSSAPEKPAVIEKPAPPPEPVVYEIVTRKGGETIIDSYDVSEPTRPRN